MPETREWDVELLEHVFEQADVEAIISTTTLVGRGADEIIWTADKQGEYSVKSGYKVYMNRCVNRLALNRSGDWSRIWQLKLPPKIRHFAWRLASREAGIWEHLYGVLNGARNMKVWIDFALSNWDEDRICNWIAMLWAVWRERNQRVWSQVSNSARTVVSGGQEAVSEWRTVRAVTRGGVGGIGNQRQICAKWHPPTQPWLKCNVDAGFKPNERKWGCGMILRSSDGAAVSCRTSWRIGKPEVREGEALALLDALLWIEQSGYEQINQSSKVNEAHRRSLEDRRGRGRGGKIGRDEADEAVYASSATVVRAAGRARAVAERRGLATQRLGHGGRAKRRRGVEDV
ncbi:hypothetical protein LINPERHAP1_LOCUS8901 [Linum perenne]